MSHLANYLEGCDSLPYQLLGAFSKEPRLRPNEPSQFTPQYNNVLHRLRVVQQIPRDIREPCSIKLD